MEPGYFALTTLPDSLLLNGRQINRDNLAEVRADTAFQNKPLVAEVFDFLHFWWDENDFVTVFTSGSTGLPKEINIAKTAMAASAGMTVRFFSLGVGMNALLCLSPNYIAGKMMVVRAMIAGMNLLTTDLSANPIKNLSHAIDFAAMVPLQLAKSLEESRENLSKIQTLILGGSAIDARLETEIQKLKVKVFHTYGMTETLSHIAIRAVNGPHSSHEFKALPGVKLSSDERGCLQITVPFLPDKDLKTNDLVVFAEDGSFQISGRIDDVIISAGRKIHPVLVERKLALLMPFDYVISSLADNSAGERVVLVISGRPSAAELFSLWQKMEEVLDPAEMPRQIIETDAIPLLTNGKTDRLSLKASIAPY